MNTRRGTDSGWGAMATGLAYLGTGATVGAVYLNTMPVVGELPWGFVGLMLTLHAATAVWRLGLSRPAATAALVGGMFGWACWLYLPRVASHFHELPGFFVSIARWVTALLVGLPTAEVKTLDGTLLTVFTDAGWVETALTWEKVDLAVVVALGFWLLLETTRSPDWVSRVKLLVGGGAILSLTVVLRLVAVAYADISANALTLYWNLPMVVVTYTPAVLLISRVLGSSVSAAPLVNEPAVSRRRGLAPIGLGASLAALIAAAFFFHPYSGAYPKRVIIDDGHSNWEWAEGEYDETGFGEKATYGSQLFTRYLGFVTDVSVNRAPLDRIDLATADVVVLKTPTRPYSEAEKKALLRYVEDGGGLLLVSDHTDLFGMSTFLNEIAEPMRLRFEADDQFELRRGGMSEVVSQPGSRRGIMSGVGKVQFLTGCTMRAPLGTETLVGQGMGAEPVDYSHVNFFGDMQAQRTDSWGAFLQMAVVEYGKGRVGAFTDSTQLSNFCSTLGDRVRFFVNTIGYIGDRAVLPRTSRLLLVAVLPFAAAAMFLTAFGAGRRSGPTIVVMLAVLGAAPFGWEACSRPVEATLPEDKERAFVLVDPDYSTALFPDFASVVPLPAETQKQCFDQFLSCAARLGFVPTVGNPMGVDVGRARHLMLPPDSDVAREAVAAEIPNRLAQGAHVVLFADWSPAQLEAVAARIRQVLGSEVKVRSTRTSDGKMGACAIEYGAGRFVAVGAKTYFSAPYLGNVYEVVKPERQRLCELALQLLRTSLIDGALPERAALESLAEEAGFAAQTIEDTPSSHDERRAHDAML